MRFQAFTYTKGDNVAKFFLLNNMHEGAQFESYSQWVKGFGFDSQNIKNGSRAYQCQLARNELERNGWALCYSMDKNDTFTPLAELKRTILTEYKSCTDLDLFNSTLVRSFENIHLDLNDFNGVLSYEDYGDW